MITSSAYYNYRYRIAYHVQQLKYHIKHIKQTKYTKKSWGHQLKSASQAHVNQMFILCLNVSHSKFEKIHTF